MSQSSQCMLLIRYGTIGQCLLILLATTECSFRNCGVVKHSCEYAYSFNDTASILSVESSQNVESNTKNVESKTEKCGVQNSIFTRNQLF